MTHAIIYKEWLKTRKYFFASALAAMALAAYAILVMNRVAELRGADHLWQILLLKDNSFIDIIAYSPMIIGMAIGIAQMAPEMASKRLKLTLHLPYPHIRMVLAMLGCGLCELLVIFGLQAAAIAIYDSTIFAPELVARVMLTALPWYFAGLCAYLLATAICLEGTWARRILLALVGAACLMTFFTATSLEAYNGAVWLMAALCAAIALLPFGSIIRFKEGRQD